ncbi:MAG TPA: hypothetical protein VNN08_08560 [Thermoanaerobaculia bacterium]|nr:hypothetical protein [Thermoanaerobaculia bacterium]
MQSENQLLGTTQVDRLVTIVEEATRATTDAPRRFIEPARGTLDRAKSRRHHLIFGRRGSGKTSLLRKAGADLSLQRIPVAFIDLEAFKGHKYPDVLISVLIETLHAFDRWLDTAAVAPSNKISFWKKLFGGSPVKPPLSRKKVAKIRESLTKQIRELSALLHTEDDAQITSKQHAGSNVAAEISSGGSLGLKSPVDISVQRSTKGSLSAETGNEITEATRRNKIDFLHRRIIDFQKLFEQIIEVSESDAYVFLDDLYHIIRKDQAYVLDYFHRIVKGRSVWLKVGTIRHRTDWYHHGNPPIGLKLGDDCDDIDLDITLEKYELARKFLLEILNQLIHEAGLSEHTDLLAEGGVERLVLASGGVARDFLTIFRRAIDVARERGVTYRGEKINAEDLNVAAGEHDPAKRDELKRDTIGEREQLERALQVIQQFCIDNKVNCFLMERDVESTGHALVSELVDLRFVHVVESRTSVRDLPGKLFTGYMLDISQYTGSRRRRELVMVAFWKREEIGRIRRPKYVLDPERLALQGGTT